jgi:16S rRNA processing protein RimM
MDGMITAGRVGGLFGNRGELTLILFESFPRDPNREEPVFVEIDGHAVPLFFDKFARRGVRGATVVFADIDTEARALELVGREFSMHLGDGRASGSDDDELYFEDLVGWEAEVGEGLTGRITAFLDSEHNPLLEISIDGENILIPAQEEFFARVDEDHRRVTFDLPDGLLELNS